MLDIIEIINFSILQQNTISHVPMPDRRERNGENDSESENKNISNINNINPNEKQFYEESESRVNDGTNNINDNWYE